MKRLSYVVRQAKQEEAAALKQKALEPHCRHCYIQNKIVNILVEFPDYKGPHFKGAEGAIYCENIVPLQRPLPTLSRPLSGTRHPRGRPRRRAVRRAKLVPCSPPSSAKQVRITLEKILAVRLLNKILACYNDPIR